MSGCFFFFAHGTAADGEGWIFCGAFFVWVNFDFGGRGFGRGGFWVGVGGRGFCDVGMEEGDIMDRRLHN